MLKNLLAVVAGVITMILGVMFSVILLAVFCVIAVAALTFFWWKTRKLRKTLLRLSEIPDLENPPNE